ncbi:MFS transporter [Actinomadura rugatobispora]|uniref:MFS transporter n=1 Tax=Actinomadura rugatobispora TaxID=1994 RepID=A0ABW0ZS60_9ACTN|nr:sugar transporter [Actinomadura rugatobispora]
MTSGTDSTGTTADTGAGHPGTARVWLTIAALSVGSFLFVTSETLPIGLLSELSADLNVSESAAGQLVTVYAFCIALGALPLTMLLSPMNRRRSLLAVFAVFVVGTALAAWSPGFGALVATRTVVALAQAAFWAIAVSYAARLAPPGQQGRAIAMVYAGISFSQFLGVPGGSALGHALGWRTAMLVMALAGLLTLLVLAAATPPMEGQAPVGPRQVAGLAAQGRVLTAIAAVALSFTGAYVAFTYLSPLLQDIGGVETGMVSIFLLLFGMAGVGGNALAGMLVDKRLTWALYLAVGGLFGTLVLFGLAARWLPVAVVSIVLWGLCGSALPTTFTSWALRLAPTGQEAMTALLVIAVNLGLGTGALVGGRLLAGPGAEAVVWGATALLGAAAAAVTVVARR